MIYILENIENTLFYNLSKGGGLELAANRCIILIVAISFTLLGCSTDQEETALEIEGLKKQLTELQSEISNLKQMQDDLTSLKKVVKENKILDLRTQIKVNHMEYTNTGVAFVFGFTTDRPHAHAYDAYRVDKFGGVIHIIPNVTDGGGHLPKVQGQIQQDVLDFRMERLKVGEKLIVRIHELDTGRIAEFIWEEIEGDI
jgi:hypothetical protein